MARGVVIVRPVAEPSRIEFVGSAGMLIGPATQHAIYRAAQFARDIAGLGGIDIEPARSVEKLAAKRVAPAIIHEAGAFDFERGIVPGKALDDRAFTASPMAQGIAKCAAILVSLADQIDEFADARGFGGADGLDDQAASTQGGLDP